METILKTSALTKSFGTKVAVSSVDMTVERGDIYGFIGKNGAGKTTLMKVVLGMLTPSGGDFELFGEAGKDISRRRIGSLIETPVFYKNCSARENMKRWAMLYGADEKQIDEKLELVGLGGAGKKKTGAFSLGMKQRLGIATALLAEPEFIILDEPVNGLDPEGIKEVRDTIVRLNKEKGVTFLVSSHLLDELSKIATKYGVIRNGELVVEASADEIYKKCTQKLKISASEPERARAVLIDAAGLDAEAVSRDGDALVVSSRIDEAATLNKILVENGILVGELVPQKDDMESYFIKMMGGRDYE